MSRQVKELLALLAAAVHMAGWFAAIAWLTLAGVSFWILVALCVVCSVVVTLGFMLVAVWFT